jgi:hypothetical protein
VCIPPFAPWVLAHPLHLHLSVHAIRFFKITIPSNRICFSGIIRRKGIKKRLVVPFPYLEAVAVVLLALGLAAGAAPGRLGFALEDQLGALLHEGRFGLDVVAGRASAGVGAEPLVAEALAVLLDALGGLAVAAWPWLVVFVHGGNGWRCPTAC